MKWYDIPYEIFYLLKMHKYFTVPWATVSITGHTEVQISSMLYADYFLHFLRHKIFNKSFLLWSKIFYFYCSQETLILWIDKGNMKLFNILKYFYSHTETCRNMQYWVNVLISFNSFITNAVILLGITRQIFKYRGFPFLLLTVDGNHSWQYSHPHSTIYLMKTTTF